LARVVPVVQQVWASIEDGAAVRDPALLCRFSALCFADLKKNRYVYWCVIFFLFSIFLYLYIIYVCVYFVIPSHWHVFLYGRFSDAAC
jgi:hypothetical protein